MRNRASVREKLNDTNHGTRYDSKADNDVSFNLSSCFGLGSAPRKQAPTMLSLV